MTELNQAALRATEIVRSHRSKEDVILSLQLLSHGPFGVHGICFQFRVESDTASEHGVGAVVILYGSW